MKNYVKNNKEKYLPVLEQKSSALDINLWDGYNVVMSRAMTSGIHNLDLNGKRIVALALCQIEQKKNAILHNGSWSIEINANDFVNVFGLDKTNVYKDMQSGVNNLVK